MEIINIDLIIDSADDYGCGYGDGSGYSDDYGCGYGDGSGYGDGYGDGNGCGNGDGCGFFTHIKF